MDKPMTEIASEMPEPDAAAAAEPTPVVAERPEAEELALEAYGRNLGIAFQLIDDAIDYVSDAGTMGKDAGDDFREGKITLPVILAFARGAADEQAFWKRTLTEGEIRPEDFPAAADLMVLREAIADTVTRAGDYVRAAKDALTVFDDGPYKDGVPEAARV